MAVAERALRFLHPVPEYVRFENPPLIEPLERRNIAGATMESRVKYYDYGIISVELRVRCEVDWRSLPECLSRWLDHPDCDAYAQETVRQALRRAAPALVKPYNSWLDEDYFIVELEQPQTARPALAAVGV